MHGIDNDFNGCTAAELVTDLGLTAASGLLEGLGALKSACTLKKCNAAKGGGRTVADTLPKGVTDIKNAKGEVLKSVHTPPSTPHAGMDFHTHPNYSNVLPDGTTRSGVSKGAIQMSRQDIIDAVRLGGQRTGGR